MPPKETQRGSTIPGRAAAAIPKAGERHEGDGHLERGRAGHDPSPHRDHKPENPSRKPPPKPGIIDDDEVPETAEASPDVRRFRWGWSLALVVTAMALGIGIMMELRHRENTAEALLTAKISEALAAHTRQHSQDARSYDEIALVDWLRLCLSATLSSHDGANANDLAGATGQAIIATAERSCLRSKLVDLATREVIAGEAARQQAGDDPVAADAIHKLDEELHFVVAFARTYGYALPEEFQVFKSDSGILKTYSDTKGAAPAGQPGWQQER
jgi:hypothetical protein